ncbi:MAG: hypothetical protein ACHP7N_14175 [Caulobacterales bacterium]
MFIADTDAEAKDRAREAYEAYRKHFAKPQPPGAPPVPSTAALAAGAAAKGEIPVGPQPARLGGPASFNPDEAMANESLLVGSPSTVRDYVRRYAEESGANYYVGSFSWGDLTHQESSKSLRLFAEEVMPAIEAAKVTG